MPNAPKSFRPHGVPSTPKQHSAQQRQRKGTTAQRGYGARWQKFRKWYFSHWFNAICGCGCRQPAQELDHIERVTGPDDERFVDPAEVIGLTARCHSRKTALADGSFGRAPSAEGAALVAKLKAEAARRAKLMQEGIGYA